MPGDSDGDGSSDDKENASGTDPFDAGSYAKEVSSPAYTEWNGFLGIANILELINRESSSTTVSVSILAQNGELQSKKQIILAPGRQLDLILNEFPGFRSDSYGLVKLEFTGKIDGRTVFYRPRLGRELGAAGSEFEFAYSLPLHHAQYGESFVSFNTFLPANLPVGQSVLQWLTLINLSDSTKAFRITSYRLNGAVLKNRDLIIPAWGRVDLEAGHELGTLPGQSASGLIGQHRITPLEEHSPYAAHLVRYGAQMQAGSVVGFSYAIPIASRAGSGAVLSQSHVAIPRGNRWLEVNNALSQNTEAMLQFFNQEGVEIGAQSLRLQPYEQRHISSSQVFQVNNAALTERVLGYVQVRGNAPGALYADHVCYHFSASLKRGSAYAVQLEESIAKELHGSFNLFLGMDNILSLANSSDFATRVRLEFIGPGEGQEIVYQLQPKASLSLSLRQMAGFAGWNDTYGTLRIFSYDRSSITAGVLRLRSALASSAQDDGGLDISIPTAMR